MSETLNGSASGGPWSAGVGVLEQAVAALPAQPGVYRMLDGEGRILYVGKAKNLKKRVVWYTRPRDIPGRLQRLVAQVRALEHTSTHTEAEALLLEGHLIKQHRPPFNILFKDDKDFPWIVLTDHPFPRPVAERGRRGGAKILRYGPFASGQAVQTTLDLLFRTFRLRSCSDGIFHQRKRPCLQYHIQRCSAPCVGLANQEEYGASVQEAVRVLTGQGDSVRKTLVERMQEASERTDYEQAAQWRDRLKALGAIQSFQKIYIPETRDMDVVGLAREGTRTCLTLFLYRQGVYGGFSSSVLNQPEDVPASDILEAFLLDTFLRCPPAAQIVLSHPLEYPARLVEALARNGHTVDIRWVRRGPLKPLVDHAVLQAERDLWKVTPHQAFAEQTMQALADQWGLPALPRRIEIYDNSHLQGTEAWSGMVVASGTGFVPRAFRAFRVRQPDLAQDDYGMMRDVMTRRFLKPSSGTRDPLPDLIILDGGQGQWQAAASVLREAGLAIPMVAMAKGPDRHAGREWLYTGEGDPVQLPPGDPVLSLMQVLRDEAHRFVITQHRKSRSKTMVQSVLDTVPGVGAARRQQLLNHFGSTEALRQAAQEDLARVPGISKALARKIREALHPSG